MTQRDRRRRKLDKMTDDEFRAIGNWWKPPWPPNKDRGSWTGRLLDDVERHEPVDRSKFDRGLNMPTEAEMEARYRRTIVGISVVAVIVMVLFGTIPFVRSCGLQQTGSSSVTPPDENGQSQQSPGGSSDTTAVEKVPPGTG